MTWKRTAPMVPALTSPDDRRRVHLGRPPVDLLGQRLVEGDVEGGRDLADDAAPRHRRMPGCQSMATSSIGLPKPKISPITTGW